MNKKIFGYIIIISVILVSLLVFLLMYNKEYDGVCGIQDCHGLEFTCGPNIPEACTMEYVAGDNCRRFANCSIIKGRCSLEYSEEFEECKSCVEKCERDARDNPIEFFQCESQCTS